MSKVDNEFMTTTEACDVLGVSKTVIKRMADSGELETWKTPGGHRRLRRSSVMHVAEQQNGLQVANSSRFKQGVVNVLVIDDDKVIHELFNAIVTNLNIPVNLVTASDGYEALLKAGQAQFDIIFVDLFMPKLDGYEVVKVLKKSEQNQSSTMVIITANSEPEIEKNLLPSEVMVLSKPLNIEVIKQFLRYESKLKAV